MLSGVEPLLGLATDIGILIALMGGLEQRKFLISTMP